MLTMNDAEFSSLYRTSEYILREVCNIEREVVTGKDQFGKEIKEWIPLTYDVKCNKSPLETSRLSEDEVIGKIWAKGTWFITVPVGTNVRTSDRIVIDGTALYVDTVLAPRSYTVVMRLVCVENE